MYEKLIVGFLDSDEGRDGLALGHMLATATGAQLLTASVFHGPLDAQAHTTAELVRAAASNTSSSATARARVLQDRSPARALQDLAAEEEADAIVLGSTHRGALGRVLIGSVAARLLTGAPCGIAVAPRGYGEGDLEGLPRVIAVGFDGSPESRRALAQASELAQACGATLRAIAVQEPEGLTQREHLEKDMRDAVGNLPSSVRANGAVRSGRAAEVLTDEAQKGVDLVVVGSRGYGPFRRVTLGGVSSAVMRSSPCPVLVVPRSPES